VWCAGEAQFSVVLARHGKDESSDEHLHKSGLELAIVKDCTLHAHVVEGPRAHTTDTDTGKAFLVHE